MKFFTLLTSLACVYGLLSFATDTISKGLRANPDTIPEKEKAMLLSLHPLVSDKTPRIMFWRPQKVGSSTLLSVILSFGFRFNVHPRRKVRKFSALCEYMKSCGKNGRADVGGVIPYGVSVNHEICNTPYKDVHKNLECAFSISNNAEMQVKELFLVRNPIDRAISVYYFWGELFKLHSANKKGIEAGFVSSNTHTRLGNASNTNGIRGATTGGSFYYHGDEKSLPPEDVALSYALKLPYSAGGRGPSYTWSLFADSVTDAIQSLNSRTSELYSLIIERLDESLIVLYHFMNAESSNFQHLVFNGDRYKVAKYPELNIDEPYVWTIADVVYVTKRKALSSHPKASQWPSSVISIIKEKMTQKGEYEVYEESEKLLNERIGVLAANGVDVKKELLVFNALRTRISTICMSDEYLDRYRDYLLDFGLPKHHSQNKLRDVDSWFSENGHEFSYNKEILYSFDVCGSCEAHGLLISLENGLGEDIETATLLKDLPESLRADDVRLRNCPK